MRNAWQSDFGGFGGMPDQAAGLRRLLGNAPLHVIAIAGDGATTLTANLAAALAVAGRDVLMIDENANHGNLADQLGINTRYELMHVLTGERALADVVRGTRAGARLLPAARGVRELDPSQREQFLTSLRETPPTPDLVLIDSAGGGVSGLFRQTDTHSETLIVAGASPDGITSAYALIKAAVRETGESRFRVVVNRARDQAGAEAIFSNMAAVAKKHAGATLELLGWLPVDPQLRLARAARRSAVEACPASATAGAVRALAQRLQGQLHIHMPPAASGYASSPVFAGAAGHRPAIGAVHAAALFNPSPRSAAATTF